MIFTQIQLIVFNKYKTNMSGLNSSLLHSGCVQTSIYLKFKANFVF